jgi:uncharacterized membrane protein
VLKIVARLGFVMVILLALVGILSVTGRFVATVEYLAHDTVARAQSSPVGPEFDNRYYAHPYLTLTHIASGFLFMTLGPLQFVAAIRNRWIGFHRWCGRVFYAASLVGVVSALAFVPILPVFGSFSTRVGVVFAGSMFLWALVKGYVCIRRCQIAQHREWMIRTFAIGLGISTFRLLIPFLMMPPLGATFVEAWDTAVWLGFGINIVAAEVWINVTRLPQIAVRLHIPAKPVLHPVET